MDGTDRPGERPGDEDVQKRRIEREREEASEAERDAADEPGYTERPTEDAPDK